MTTPADVEALYRLPRTSAGYLDVTDPALAAQALLTGIGVEYCPGDGSRYVCVVVARAALDTRQWLLVENFGFTLLLDGSYTLDHWCRSRVIPSGSWSALRPLLKALGVLVPGLPRFNPRDAEDEGRVRLRTADGEPFTADDARLGRIVRNALAAEARP